MKDTGKSREIMISRNGKPLFAVCLNPDTDGDASYVFIEDGDVKFASSWMRSIQPFSLGNESHRIAKEIFTEGLRTAIKVKILELKQLESIFNDIGLADCMGSILVDNTRLLLEVKNSLVAEIQEVKCKSASKTDVAEAVEAAIVDNVQPIALKKESRKPKKTNSDNCENVSS